MCQNDEAIPPFPDTRPALKATQVAIGRHTTVLTVRRILEHCLARVLSKRVLWKLMKDTARSAERKASRALAELAPALTRASRLARTALRGAFAVAMCHLPCRAAALASSPPFSSHGRPACETDQPLISRRIPIAFSTAPWMTVQALRMV